MADQSQLTAQALLCTVTEACGLLAASEPIVRRLIADGDIPVVRLDSKIRIRRADIDTLIERRLERAGVIP